MVIQQLSEYTEIVELRIFGLTFQKINAAEGFVSGTFDSVLNAAF